MMVERSIVLHSRMGAAIVALLIGAAAVADDAPIPTGKARVLVLIESPAPSYPSILVALDGQPYRGEVPLILDPGHHTLTLRCFFPEKTTIADLAFGESPQMDYLDVAFPMELQAQHEYRSDDGSPDSKDKHCAPYFYDSTDGRDADSETVQVEPVAGSYGKWHKFAALEHAGHYVHDSLPVDQYRQQLAHIGTLRSDVAYQRPGWRQMFEIESWVTATYAGKAADFYQKWIDAAKRGCPSSQITVLSQSDTDVLYDLESGPDCSRPRTIIGRFLTGPYDVHHVVIYSRVSLQDADKTAWISALKGATITEDN